MAQATVDWQALYFDEHAAWPTRLMARARRRFGDSPDAEAAYNYAIDTLSENDWARLREKYRGTGSAEGFMTISFLNLLEEYGVRKYGRPRPPAWVQRLGEPWTRIFELLCLRREAPERIVDLLLQQGHEDPPALHQAIRQVRGRIPTCGQRLGEESAGETTPEPIHTATPVQDMDNAEVGHLLGALLGLAESASTEALTASARQAAGDAALQLSPKERLLLRLVYEENCSIPQAAHQLQMNERTARRTHTRLLGRLREALAPYALAASEG